VRCAVVFNPQRASLCCSDAHLNDLVVSGFHFDRPCVRSVANDSNTSVAERVKSEMQITEGGFVKIAVGESERGVDVQGDARETHFASRELNGRRARNQKGEEEDDNEKDCAADREGSLLLLFASLLINVNGYVGHIWRCGLKQRLL